MLKPRASTQKPLALVCASALSQWFSLWRRTTFIGRRKRRTLAEEIRPTCSTCIVSRAFIAVFRSAGCRLSPMGERKREKGGKKKVDSFSSRFDPRRHANDTRIHSRIHRRNEKRSVSVSPRRGAGESQRTKKQHSPARPMPTNNVVTLRYFSVRAAARERSSSRSKRSEKRSSEAYLSLENHR